MQRYIYEWANETVLKALEICFHHETDTLKFKNLKFQQKT